MFTSLHVLFVERDNSTSCLNRNFESNGQDFIYEMFVAEKGG